jgi:hypothetical protein
MIKKPLVGVVLVAAMGLVSESLLAEIAPAPEHPANILAPATSTTDHQDAVALHKKHEGHHRAMVEHHKSIAEEYGTAGQKGLKKHHEELAKHHEALAKEHAKITTAHESLATPKK